MADFDWTQRRILIVDSDLDFLSWGDSTLRQAGVGEVRCTMVCGDVVNILKQFAADAVVFDLEADDGGSLESLARLRDEGTSPNPSVPVVIKADPANVQKIREACRIGVESLFRKTVDVKTFLNRVSGAIRAPRRLVAAETYFGPDRRWGDEDFEGEDRRSVVAVAVQTVVPDQVPKAEEGINQKDDVDRELLHTLDDHAEWLQSNGKNGVRANLEGKDFYGVSLNRADLTRANLQDINLEDAACMKTVFDGADLTKADLSHGNFAGASFGRAKLCSAVLAGARLKGADLHGADLTGADLRGASLREADLTKTILVGADLRGTDLRDAEGLTQDQLKTVRADAATRLSKDLKHPALKS
jgi:ActR/RegA family two-component response regulator